MAEKSNKRDVLFDELISFISKAPAGASAGEAHKNFHTVSRPTINRWLKDAVDDKLISTSGSGSYVVYVSADPLLSIRQYFDRPLDERPVARYHENFLEFSPSAKILSTICPHINPEYLTKKDAVAPLDKRDFVQFLIDFSCASSALEGGTYSQLDTQALIEYGELAEGKSTDDAFLVLNHKNALEYLYSNLSIDEKIAIEVHRLLTTNHGLPALKDSLHFLNKDKMGVREYDEVNIRTTTYLPPFRPGSQYVDKMFNKIIETAKDIENPIESSFYLFSRIPYLQPFCDGNKRTSRALCNVPLLKAGLPPISFMDFSKRDYIISMLSIYELRDTKYAENTFAQSYLKSIKRLGTQKIAPPTIESVQKFIAENMTKSYNKT